MGKRLFAIFAAICFVLAFAACETQNGMSVTESSFVSEASEAEKSAVQNIDNERRNAAYANAVARLESFEFDKIDEGLLLSTMCYVDNGEKNVKLYIATADIDKYTFMTGTPDDEFTLGKVQNVSSQAAAAYKKGKNVVLAVNGSFFQMGAGDYPIGPMVKDGIDLYDDANVGHIGCLVNEAGKLHITTRDGYRDNYRFSALQVIAGMHRLVVNGEIYDVGTGDGNMTSRRARTAVGITSGGDKLVIMIVDENSSESSGISLENLANLFIWYNCPNALNLDGGGSTAMVQRSGNGKFTLVNSVHGGTWQRPVANSLLLVKR